MKRLPPGIWRTPTGYRAAVCVGGTREWKRGTDLAALITWQRHTTARLRALTPTRGTLGADVAAYLQLVRGMPTLDNRRRDLDYWIAALGRDTPRLDITAEDVRDVLVTWRETRAASTVNHRRSALSHLYRVLDGASAPNPVRDCAPFRPPDAQAHGLPAAVVAAIFAAMPESRTRRQLMVLAYTGLPPIQIQRLQPAHFDAAAASLWIEGRQKGAGTPGRRVPLTDQGKAALEAFAAAKLWGERLRTTTSRTVLNRALARVRADHPDWTLPAWMRPYDLRHSFCGWVYQATGGNLGVLAEMAGHADLATSRRYALAAVPAVSLAAARLVSQALSVPPGVPMPGNAPKLGD